MRAGPTKRVKASVLLARFERIGGASAHTLRFSELDADARDALLDSAGGASSISPLVVSLRSSSEWLAVTEEGLVWRRSGKVRRARYEHIESVGVPWEGLSISEADKLGELEVCLSNGRTLRVSIERSGVVANRLLALLPV